MMTRFFDWLAELPENTAIFVGFVCPILVLLFIGYVVLDVPLAFSWLIAIGAVAGFWTFMCWLEKPDR